MYKTALMPDNVWIFLPLLLHGIAVMLGLCLCHLAAPRQSATDPRRAGVERSPPASRSRSRLEKYLAEVDHFFCADWAVGQARR